MDTKKTPFDAGSYWEGRHRKFQGDNRNVGDIALTSEQNYELIAVKAAIVSHAIGRLGVARGADVLDAGCGAGVFTSMLAKAGFAMHGVDVSQTAIATARGREDAEFVVGPLSKPAFEKSFDVVLCLDVLFHVVDDDEWKRSVETLFASVKPGGHLVLIEYFPASGARTAPHCRWRSAEIYRSLLATRGAEAAELVTFSYPHRKEDKTLLTARKPAPAAKWRPSWAWMR